MREYIKKCWIDNQYNYDKVLRILNNAPVFPIDNVWEDKYNQHYITIIDDNYPQSLKALEKPPLCLFYNGKLQTLYAKFKIGIIGSRINSEYGEKVVLELIKQLNKEFCIVSGLAMGIDGLAHQYAKLFTMPTIAIIGSGLKYQYPSCNKALYQQVDLVVSEYGYDEAIRKHHFVERNRIIAAISDILIVIESNLKSGTHISVNEMLNLGKEVYVVPHDLFSKNGKGNNLLIQEGANIIYDIEEFCTELNKNYATLLK